MIINRHYNPIYGIGVDIGGTKTLIILSDSQGHIVYRDRLRTSSNLDELVNMIKQSITRAKIPDSNLAGMGIGVPGRVNSVTGYIIDVPSLKWENLNLSEVFKSHFNVPIFINNDVNLAVTGEKWLGNGKNCNNLFYLAIGTGIGGALIINGEIVAGSSFSAGEVGYLIDRDDLQNGLLNCHQEFGTFEKKTSGTALAQKGQEIGFTPPQLFQEYSNGNPKVIPIIEDFILNISIVIANIASLINPETVIIGGGVSESMSIVIDKIRDKVISFTPIQTKIALSMLGGDAAALGGVGYVFQKVSF
jgi:glucokinase